MRAAKTHPRPARPMHHAVASECASGVKCKRCCRPPREVLVKMIEMMKMLVADEKRSAGEPGSPVTIVEAVPGTVARTV